MYYIVKRGRIIGSAEDGAELKSIGQLRADQIMVYLADCTDWNDLLVAPLFHELCERLGMDFDEYDTYDELYDEVFNKMLDLIEVTARYDFHFRDEVNHPMTTIEAVKRLKKHAEEDPAIPIWCDEYVLEYNNCFLEGRNEK